MKLSQKIALIIVIAYCMFHTMVLLQVIPYNLVWGGNLKSVKEMYIFEGFALAVMLFIAVILSMKTKLIKPFFSAKTIRRIVLVFAVFFLLNTVGNLLAETLIEKYQAIITLYLSFVFFGALKPNS